ncbi:lactonase family protein [Reichenbachiella sp. MSK19-1]|uniref:lactonase family protein n=1 Tax=Reichenbachiella sp. MSK19-1 TaxID=1897631 RepID=UPI000E6D41ED|nr:lactonase family protein [Reichenbachiella sp. MSK19-1]
MKLQLLSLLVGCSLLACTSQSEEKTVDSTTENTTEMLTLLVGTYTGQGSDGIYSVQFDPSTGVLSKSQLLVETTSPSFLAYSQDKQKVYAVNETENGGVSSFAWDENKSKLKLVSRRASEGDYPCYVSINPSETLVSVANYGTGNVISYPIDKSGVIATAGDIQQHEGTGTNPDRQEGPHAHFAQYSKDGTQLYAIDLGIDQVIKYPVTGGKIGAGETALNLEPGDGPRHLVFHPTKALVYVISELSSTVTTAQVNEDGTFETVAQISTLPENIEGDSYCADIHISDDGRYLYASNRGHNSIAIFSVDEETGALARIANEPVQGDWPRNFCLTPDNKHILVANQKSDNITVFERDDATGMMHFTGNEIKISQPVCVIF